MSDVVSSAEKVPGDFLIHVESLEFCTKTVKIRNGAGTAVNIANVVGYPLKAGASGADYVLAVAGDEANVTAFLVDGPTGQATETLAATTNSTKKYQALVHPPAILNQNKFPLTDFAGAAFTQATLRTRAIALGYELRSEPSKSTTL